MARVMENHSQYLLPIPDVTSTTTRGFATQVHAELCTGKGGGTERSKKVRDERTE